MIRNKKRFGAIVAVIAVFAIAGGAYAYWTSTGSGTGSASTAASTSALTVNQTSTLNAMYPGDSAQTLSGTFNNPNSGPIHVNTVTASISSVTKANGVTGTCDASDYTLSNAAMTVNQDVSAGNGQGTWSGATIKFNNKASNQDACKGATVNLAYTVG